MTGKKTVSRLLARVVRNRRAIALVMIALTILGIRVIVLEPIGGTTLAAPPPQKPTPHSTEGRQDCLQCHSVNGVKPAPSNHEGRPVGTCLTCHPLAQQAPTLTPASGTTPVLEPSPSLEASPAPSLASNEGNCLACHSNTSLKFPLPSGEELPLNIDLKDYAASIHADKLSCTDCHKNLSGYPHPKWEFSDRRAYTLAQYELCKRCHFANYTKTLESIHYTILEAGDKRSPVCVDCHGAHDVSSPDKPKVRIAQSCASCHEDVHQTYISSVHGKALLDESNQDVPVCTDCHGAHDIQDPRTAAARQETPELCARCHGDAKLMGKFGLSTAVVKTYLQDFHGVTVSLYRKQGPDILSYTAVCTDCHGVHNVTRTDDPEAGLQMKSNLVSVCRKCHPDAAENFPAAWLSHYEPSPEKAPLVYYSRLFYWILIPFIIGGLLLHILLDLWRVATNR